MYVLHTSTTECNIIKYDVDILYLVKTRNMKNIILFVTTLDICSKYTLLTTRGLPQNDLRTPESSDSPE